MLQKRQKEYAGARDFLVAFFLAVAEKMPSQAVISISIVHFVPKKQTSLNPSATFNESKRDRSDRDLPVSVTPNELIVELARSLHTGGASADELEQRMEQAAEAIGTPAHFFSTPTSLFVTFANEPGSTRLIRVMPAEVNLAKLSRLYVLYREINESNLDVQSAWEMLQEIEAANYDYGDWLNVICFGVTGAGVAVFLGGDVTVMLASGIIGAIVGMLIRGCERARLPGHLGIVAAAFVATILANVVQQWFPDGSVELTLLASLIVLVPGLQITVSVKELATQNLASGTARMAGAMTTFLTMIFGVVMGYGFSEWFFRPPTPVEAEPLGMGWAVAVLIPLAISFGVLFRARKRDAAWILAAIVIAFGTARMAGIYLSPIAAAFSTALVVGVVSNLFGRFCNRPAAIMQMPGLLMLVPGSMGFSGFSAIILHNDMPSGLKIVFTMALVAVSLVAGLLIANVICPIENPTKRY